MRLTLSEAFEVLGVPQDTSPELVRQAYRQLALRFHPDKNPDADATATFQRVSAAYKRICDHRERQQQAPGTWASTGSPFFDVSDDEMDEDDLGFDDDVSLEEMLFMFKMMFGVSSGGRKQPASNRTRQGGKAEVSPGGNQPKAPGVRVNIGGRRRQTKGKRKAKHSHGLQDFDPDMMDIEDEMARMFMADPFAFNADELDSDEDAEFMDLARLLAMGGQPAMQSLFGGASKQCPRRSNNATQQQQDKHHGKQERASTDGDAEVAKSSQPLVVGASVQVYGRLAGVVKFVGQVHYAKGEFVGVELCEAAGKNSGVIKGVNYFSCAPGHGLMVRPTDVSCAASA